MLRRGYHSKAKASGKTEEGQEENEDNRLGLHSSERLSRRLEIGYGQLEKVKVKVKVEKDKS